MAKCTPGYSARSGDKILFADPGKCHATVGGQQRIGIQQLPIGRHSLAEILNSCGTQGRHLALALAGDHVYRHFKLFHQHPTGPVGQRDGDGGQIAFVGAKLPGAGRVRLAGRGSQSPLQLGLGLVGKMVRHSENNTCRNGILRILVPRFQKVELFAHDRVMQAQVEQVSRVISNQAGEALAWEDAGDLAAMQCRIDSKINGLFRERRDAPSQACPNGRQQSA